MYKIYAQIGFSTNDKHSTKDLLRPKNLRFLSRTNLIKNRCNQLKDYG